MIISEFLMIVETSQIGGAVISCSGPEDTFSSYMILLSRGVVAPTQLFPCVKVTRA